MDNTYQERKKDRKKDKKNHWCYTSNWWQLSEVGRKVILTKFVDYNFWLTPASYKCCTHTTRNRSLKRSQLKRKTQNFVNKSAKHIFKTSTIKKPKKLSCADVTFYCLNILSNHQTEWKSVEIFKYTHTKNTRSGANQRERERKKDKKEKKMRLSIVRFFLTK